MFKEAATQKMEKVDFLSLSKSFTVRNMFKF